MKRIVPEEKLTAAFEAGLDRGYMIASGITDGTLLSYWAKAGGQGDLADSFQELAYEVEDNGRQLSSFASAAAEYDEDEDSEELWKKFDEGVGEGIEKAWKEFFKGLLDPIHLGY